MKISNKLILALALSIGPILVINSFLLWYMAENHRSEVFFGRLENQLQDLQAKKNNPSDSDTGLRETSKFKTMLIEWKGKENLPDSLKNSLEADFFTALEKNQRAESEVKSGHQTLGRIIPIDNVPHLFILSGVDRVGNDQVGYLLRLILIGFLLSLLAIVLTTTILTGKALNPVAVIIRKVNEIKAANLHVRLEETDRQDEIGDLVRTFNSMLERLELAFEMQRHFISNASHELRNPLTAILGEAEITLEKDRDPESYREALGKIASEATRLDQLVTNLLSLAKTDLNKSHLIRNQVRLDEVVLIVKSRLDRRYPGNHVSLDLDLPDEPEEITITGNENLLVLAFGNLSANAIKFSNNKPVEIKLGTNRTGPWISVTDQGIGIPETEKEKVLEPFYRASNARIYEGSGIGLPLSKKILNLHDATLNIQSKPGQGTTITIQFGQQG